MKHPIRQPATALTPLTITWLALVALTLLSLYGGQWLHGAAWLQLLVAAIVWIKSRLVARNFIESDLAHPYIRNLLRGFIVVIPMVLIVSVFYAH